jgi:hypothetical protein
MRVLSCSRHPRDDRHGDGLDNQILLDQVPGHFDTVTREMILRRIEGHSWGEIGSEFDLSNDAARVGFSKALQWLRTSVETPWNGSLESTLPRTKKYFRPRDRKAQRVAAFERRLDRMLQRLGHAGGSPVADTIYTHVISEGGKRIAAQLANAVWGIWTLVGRKRKTAREWSLPSRLLSTKIGCGGPQCTEDALLLPFRYELKAQEAA